MGQLEYACVIVVFYSTCVGLLISLIWKFGIKGRNTITLLAGVGLFASLAHRNFEVFILSRMTFNESIMLSNYFGSICAIIFIYGFWKWHK